MWVLLSEIFPNRVRGLAISCVGLVNSSVCFVAQLIFPWQMEHLGGAQTFLIYAMFAILGVALLARMLPETRGRSLEELEKSLVHHS
jgi:MFS family permease